MTLMASIRQLSEAILDQGIQNTNYFNGRILNAGDLQTDQDANRAQHEQLASAIGSGVVQGLWVELVTAGSGTTAPVVSVSAGLALNRDGQAVALPVGIQLALARETPPLPVDAGLFADCAPPTATAVPQQAGFYILAVSPASGFSGQAPMFSFGDVTAATGCGSQYAVEGVRFRLVQLDVTTLGRLSQATQDAIAKPGTGLTSQTDAASLSKLRNWIAHICFGTEEIAGFVVNPLARASIADPLGVPAGQSPYVAYGALDALLASGALTTGDVPLALLYWTNQGVQFLDRWSVRRQPVPPLPTTAWPLLLSHRRRSEAEAMLLQFEEQLRSLSANQINIASVAADAYFAYLPPAGLLPVSGREISIVTGSPAPPAFDMPTFFGAHASDDVATLDGDAARTLFAQALDCEAMPLPQTGAIQLYLIWENLEAINAGSGAQLALIFASPAMPYRGVARFGAAEFSLSRFPPRIL